MTTNLNINSRLKEDQLKFKIGQRLKELRTAQGLTIDALREKLSLEVQKAGIDIKGEGVSKSMISRWENGKSQPSAPYIRAYATLFNVDMNYILGKDLHHEAVRTTSSKAQAQTDFIHDLYRYIKTAFPLTDDIEIRRLRNNAAHGLIEEHKEYLPAILSEDDSFYLEANKNSFEELIVTTLRESLPLATKPMIDKYREIGAIISHLMEDTDTFIRFFLTIGQLQSRGKLDSFLTFTIDQFYEPTKDIKELELSRDFIKYLKAYSDKLKQREENYED
jgi:transcription regulator|nr:MAG TPA: helix-turn-helix domain protein [Caudoviricetes sp.]